MFPKVLPKEDLPVRSTQTDWCYIYRDKIYPLIDEDKFRHLFEEEDGAPNKSIKMVISILIFMGLEKFTWRGAEFCQRHLFEAIWSACRLVDCYAYCDG